MVSIIYNTFNVPAQAYSNHSRSPGVVEPGHELPAGTTMLTIRSLNKNVLVWSRELDNILYTTNLHVVGGRGNHTRRHLGNIYFTQLVAPFAQEYRTSTSARKDSILNEIAAHMNDQGRYFVKLDLYDQQLDIWYWVLDPRPRAKIANKIRDMMKDPQVRLVNHHLPAPPPPPMMAHATVQDPTVVLFEEQLLNNVLAVDDILDALVADQENLADIFENNLLDDGVFIEDLALLRDSLLDDAAATK